MSAKLKRSAVVFAVALTGCEFVAGIHDLEYRSPDAGGGGPSGTSGDGSADDAESGGDAPQTNESGSDQAVPPQAGNDTGSEASPDDAPSGTVTRDAAPEGDQGSASEGGTDGNPPGNSVDAGPIGSNVPIPGPDGGPLHGPDGGLLSGELIDDIDTESDPGWILAKGGRVGTWFTYEDPPTDGGVVPAPNSSPATSVGPILGWDGQGNNLAIHVTGNGLAATAGTGFNFNAVGGAPATYDATAYQGFVFWARIGGASGTTSVVFQVKDKNTDPAGGVCTAASDGGTSGCYDYFSKSLRFASNWQQFVVSYSQLGQAGFGLPRGLSGVDSAHIYSCQFQLAAGSAFDIWVDDLYFISR